MTGLDLFNKINEINEDILTLDIINQDISDKELPVMKSHTIQRAIMLLKKEKERLKSQLSEIKINQ